MVGNETNFEDYNATLIESLGKVSELLKNFNKSDSGSGELAGMFKDLNGSDNAFDMSSSSDMLKELDITHFGSGEDDDFSLLDLFALGPPSISALATSFTSVTLVAFFYYVPRMLYFRCTRFSKDVRKNGFIIIIFLSFLGIIGAIIHTSAFHQMSQIDYSNTTNNSLDLDDNTDMMYQTLVKTSNRIVSPVVLLLVIQQYLMYTETPFSAPFQNSVTQISLCFIVSGIIGLATYATTLASFEIFPEQGIYNPLDVDANLYDIGFPLITAGMFFWTKSQIHKKIKYTAGEDQVSYMDRVNKVVVFQLVMSLAAITSYVLRDPTSNSWTDGFFHFFVAAHTSVVHLMLLRSLLRSNPPRRVCFLLFCSTVDQITADQVVHPDIEMAQKERNEDTQETIDHNKSIQIKMT